MRWAELPPARRAIELGNLGITAQDLVLDLRDAARGIPELRDALARCGPSEDYVRLALEWFGDEGQPQPRERSYWSVSSGRAENAVAGSPPGYRTPDWPDWPGGRMPRLDDDEPVAATETRSSSRGRKDKSVSEEEANKAAAIYLKNRAIYASRNDGGAYAVHEHYTRNRDPDPGLLSRRMVGHLIRAIEDGRLPWDEQEGQLRILDEFRTSPGMFVIPRREPAS